MNHRLTSFVITILWCFTGCEYHDLSVTIDSYEYVSDSFYPMAVGNYWQEENGNYRLIRDTIRVGGVLYYEFESLSGDIVFRERLRIDNENNLIQQSGGQDYIMAKFNSSVGHSFSTLYDLTVITISKSDNRMKFEYRNKYYPGAHSTYTKAYKKGLGPVSEWKEVRIDDVVYKYD